MTLRDVINAGIVIQGNIEIITMQDEEEIVLSKFENCDGLIEYDIDEIGDLEVNYMYAIDGVGLRIEVTT